MNVKLNEGLLGVGLAIYLFEVLLLEQTAKNTVLLTIVVNVYLDSEWHWLIFVHVLCNSFNGNLIEK